VTARAGKVVQEVEELADVGTDERFSNAASLRVEPARRNALMSTLGGKLPSPG